MSAKSFLLLVFYVAMVLVQWQTPVAAARPVRSLLSQAAVTEQALKNNDIVEGKALDDIIEKINKGTLPNQNSNSNNTKPYKPNEDYQNETVIFVLPADDDGDRDEQAETDLQPAGNEGDAPIRRGLARGFVEHGNWPKLTEVTGRTSMGPKDPVQCQSNMRQHGAWNSGYPKFHYTADEKMRHEWIAGVDRAWFSKNDRRGEVSHICGKCIRLQDPDTGKRIGPKFMLVDRIYQKPGRSYSSIDIAAAPFKSLFGGHNPKKYYIPAVVGC